MSQVRFSHFLQAGESMASISIAIGFALPKRIDLMFSASLIASSPPQTHLSQNVTSKMSMGLILRRWSNSCRDQQFFKQIVFVGPYSLFSHFRRADVYDETLVARIINDSLNHLTELSAALKVDDAIVVERNFHKA